MQAKLLLIVLCAFTISNSEAQEGFNTFGKFRFQGAVSIPDSYITNPGQLTKDGKEILLSLLYDDLDTTFTALYLKSLGNNGESSLKKLEIGIPEGYKEILQSSISSNGSTIVCTVNDYGGWITNDLAISFKNIDGTYTTPIVLDGINAADQSDSYPWLSHDGLRLYYIKDSRIYYSERNGDKSLFQESEVLKFNGQVDLNVISVWLDKKEKKLWILSDGVLYTAKRKNRKQAFSLPEVFTSEFNSLNFVSSVSLNNSMKDIFLFYSGEETFMLHYTLK